MNDKTIRALVEAGAVKKVLLIADGGAIHVDIVTQAGSVTATTIKGAIKTWATIDSSAKWLKGLGVGEAQLEISRWLPDQKRMSI